MFLALLASGLAGWGCWKIDRGQGTAAVLVGGWAVGLAVFWYLVENFP